jgi:hypothetical protein
MKFNGIKNFKLVARGWECDVSSSFYIFWLLIKFLFFPYLTVHSLVTQKVMRS